RVLARGADTAVGGSSVVRPPRLRRIDRFRRPRCPCRLRLHHESVVVQGRCACAASVRGGSRLPRIRTVDVTELREVVQELVARHGIPGAVVGVLEDGRVEAEAAGIANLNSGIEMTPDTLFLTGSITKVWTTTLLMSMVEQGLIDLDAPVKQYLPDFE